MPVPATDFTIVLLACGLAAVLVYVATVTTGAAIRPGYSHVANAISELVERDAPRQTPLNLAFAVYNALSIAFGAGLVGLGAGGWVVAAGWLLIATGGSGILMSWFPMDPVGTRATARGIGHLVLAGVMSLATIAAILCFALGNAAGHPWLATFSWLALAVVAISGAVAAISAARRWPKMGLIERITIGGFLVWLAVVAVTLLAA
jgi:hypothetical membrane protein